MLSFFQFWLLITLILQCYGIVIAYKFLQARRNSLLCAYLCTKRKKWQERRKHLKICRLCRISMRACTTHVRNNSIARAGTITWEKVRVSARLAQTGLKFQPELKLLSYNRTRYFNRISSRGRAENSPCNQPLSAVIKLVHVVTIIQLDWKYPGLNSSSKAVSWSEISNV